jgi:Tetratricopeptide repeat
VCQRSVERQVKRLNQKKQRPRKNVCVGPVGMGCAGRGAGRGTDACVGVDRIKFQYSGALLRQGRGPSAGVGFYLISFAFFPPAFFTGWLQRWRSRCGAVLVVGSALISHLAWATTPATKSTAKDGSKSASTAPFLTPAQQQNQALADVSSLVTQGDLSGALQRVQRATAAQPQDVQLRFVQGVLLMDLQRNDEAFALFTLMTQQYPELPDPHNNLALLHVRAGRFEAARQALLAALRNDNSHRTARINLGQVYLLLAQQTWEQAAEQAPLDAAAQNKLDAVRSLARGAQR